MNESSKQFIKSYLRSCSVEDKEEILNFILVEMGRYEPPSAVAQSAGAPPIEVEEQKAEAPTGDTEGDLMMELGAIEQLLLDDEPPIEVVPQAPPVEVGYIPVGVAMVQPRVVPVEEAKAEPDNGPDNGPGEMYPNIQGRECLAMRWKIYLTHLPAIIANSPNHHLVSITTRRIEFREDGYRGRAPIQYVCSNGDYSIDSRDPIVSRIFRHLRINLKDFTTRGTPVMVRGGPRELGTSYMIKDVKIKKCVISRGGTDYNTSMLNVFPYPNNSTRFFDEERAEMEIRNNLRQGYIHIPTLPPRPPAVNGVRRNLQQTLTLGGTDDCPCCLEPCETKLSGCKHPICRGCRDTIYSGVSSSRKCPLCRARL